MRALPLILAAASLAMTGCGKKQAESNISVLDESTAAEQVITNDTMSIDAATGADANMAPNSDFNQAGNSNSGDSAPAVRPHAKPRATQPAAANSTNSTPEPLQPVTPANNSTAG